MKKITLLFTLFCFALGFAQDPSSAAPTPSKAAADVISVFSDAYTIIATNLNPIGDNKPNATEIQIDGNNTLNTPTSITKDWITHNRCLSHGILAFGLQDR